MIVVTFNVEIELGNQEVFGDNKLFDCRFKVFEMKLHSFAEFSIQNYAI
jgi:hypothetical protein